MLSRTKHSRTRRQIAHLLDVDLDLSVGLLLLDEAQDHLIQGPVGDDPVAERLDPVGIVAAVLDGADDPLVLGLEQ
jgi:hypothetical protein